MFLGWPNSELFWGFSEHETGHFAVQASMFVDFDRCRVPIVNFQLPWIKKRVCFAMLVSSLFFSDDLLGMNLDVLDIKASIKHVSQKLDFSWFQGSSLVILLDSIGDNFSDF